MTNYRRNRWLLAIGLIVLLIVLVWLQLLITRALWDYVTDHMFAGAQEAGLVADTIGWADAVVLSWFASWTTGVMSLAVVGRFR